jgi:hypothetical protein
MYPGGPRSALVQLSSSTAIIRVHGPQKHSRTYATRFGSTYEFPASTSMSNDNDSFGRCSRARARRLAKISCTCLIEVDLGLEGVLSWPFCSRIRPSLPVYVMIEQAVSRIGFAHFPPRTYARAHARPCMCVCIYTCA